MEHAISIIGFEQEFSNQVAQLLLSNNLTCSVNTISDVEDTDTPGCKKTDIVVINGHDPLYARWLRKCARLSLQTPPASLVICNDSSQFLNIGDERRAAPRIKLSPAELTGRRLVSAIHELVRSRTTTEQKTVNHPVFRDVRSEYSIPVHIGGYSINQSIGNGGVGVVFEATTSSNQAVAIKLIDSENISDFRVLDRFIDEYELLSRVDHPHVIQVHEQGFTDTHLYIVMELLTGGTLKEKIQNDLPVEQALQNSLHICHALATIHDLGILHRDIKPTNVLFDDNGQPVITDFGIAKINGPRRDIELTMQGEAVGTPAYMSPEQVLGREVTTSSDLYAFGIMLYQMLSGKLPFQAGSPVSMMQKHVNDRPPHLPHDLVDFDPVVQRLLDKNPDNRYSSAWALYQDLEQFVM